MALTIEQTKGVLVYMEQTNGALRNVGFELLCQGRGLADIPSVELTDPTLTAENGEQQAQQAIHPGSDKVSNI